MFHWRIIVLQFCDGFCHTSTGISLRHTHVPSFSKLPPLHPPPRGCHRAGFGFFASYSKFPLFFFFFVVDFVIHWNETAMGLHVFSIPIPSSHLPLHPLPLGFPSAPGPSACLMHPTWAGDLFHPRKYTYFDAVLLKHPTLAFSHRV